ncbi:MAG: hypothetical protein P1P84_12855 [Deferrisomatales bacterium]|nr:hypothetical protein [Deferrisomatales bacterium]
MAVVLLGAALWGLAAAPAEACFGARLRVGVPSAGAGALAAFAIGYYVEEKTGIEPEFVELAGTPQQAIAEHAVDLVLAAEDVPPPALAEVRMAGDVPGLGPARFWLHPEVLDDLRFFTVERVLGRAGKLFASPAYAAAVASEGAARQAARQAVLRAE